MGETVGHRVDREVTNEADHFLYCPAGGGYFDTRDLAQAIEHPRPLPRPAEGRAK